MHWVLWVLGYRQGGHRMTKFHFICAPGFGKDAGPLMVTEPSGFRCHYNVTWPTKHACPTGSFLWETWHTITLRARQPPFEHPTATHSPRCALVPPPVGSFVSHTDAEF